MSKKTTAILLYIVAALFMIVAVVKMYREGFSEGVIWMCLGSSELCIASSIQRRDGKDKGEE